MPLLSDKFSSDIETVTKIAGVSATVLIAGAVFSDFAYWWVVDPEVFSLMTLSDHVTSALINLPIIALSMISLFVAYGYAGPLLLSPSQGPSRLTLQGKHGVLFSIVAAILFGGLAVLVRLPPLSWLFASFACAVLLVTARRRYTSLGLTRTQAFGLGICVYSVFIAFFVGGMSGNRAKHTEHTRTHLISLTGDRSISNAYELHFLTQGLFLIDGDKKTNRIIPWSDIKEIQSYDSAQ